jgi:hypothetical protein
MHAVIVDGQIGLSERLCQGPRDRSMIKGAALLTPRGDGVLLGRKGFWPFFWAWLAIVAALSAVAAAGLFVGSILPD